jgi:histidinol dehydrogenase
VPEIEIRTLDFREINADRLGYQKRLPRARLDIAHATAAIEPILEAVAFGDEQSILDLSEKFDGVRARSLRTPQEVIDEAVRTLDPQIKAALIESIRRVRIAHEAQSRKTIHAEVVPGGVIEHRFVPVDRVGLYVPGGRAVYPSSVVMNVVPAQIAGVPSIAIASPPQKENNGWPHPTILAAASLLGVNEIYAIGGAQAVALFAYGLSEVDPSGIEKIICPKVDLVTGPGNIYVAAAKRALRGLIQTDSEAGPTEVAVLADSLANPSFIAADMISQAEHDVIAAAVLVTDSPELGEAVRAELSQRVAKTKHSDRIATALAGEQSAIVLVRDIQQGIEVVNAYAAEHLELQVQHLDSVASQIRNAGAVFMGEYSPVSLGDYSAGSNHVLPTGGCACHSAGLSVQTFLKGVSFIRYNKEAFDDIADTVITLANAEDLPAHGEAMSVRWEKE